MRSATRYVVAKWTTLGLALLAAGFSTAPALGDLEPFQSPYKQYAQGTPIWEIQCADLKVLMQSPGGTPACVYQSSVDRLVQNGFAMLEPVGSGDPAPQETPAGNAYAGGGSVPDGEGVKKDVSVMHRVVVPDSIDIGQTASIAYTFSWFYPNGTPVPGEDLLWVPECIHESGGICWEVPTPEELREKPRRNVLNRILIFVPDEFTVLNGDKRAVDRRVDTHTPHGGTYYRIDVPQSGITVGNIDIRLDRQLYHDRDMMKIVVEGGHEYYFQTQRTDDGARLVGRGALTDQYDIRQANYTTHGYLSEYGSGDPYGRYDETHYVRPDYKPDRTVAVASEPDQAAMYPPREDWAHLAEFVRSQIQPKGIIDAGAWLLASGLSEEFVHDFSAEYPELDMARDSPVYPTGAAPPPIPFVPGHHMSLVTDKQVYKQGEPVTVRIINTGTRTLSFPTTGYGFGGTDAYGSVTFWSGGGEVITNIAPGSEAPRVWCPTADYANPAPPGVYHLHSLSYSTGASVTVTIEHASVASPCNVFDWPMW